MKAARTFYQIQLRYTTGTSVVHPPFFCRFKYPKNYHCLPGELGVFSLNQRLERWTTKGQIPIIYGSNLAMAGTGSWPVKIKQQS